MSSLEQLWDEEFRAAELYAARAVTSTFRASVHCEHPGYNGVADLGSAETADDAAYRAARTATELAAARVERTGGYASPEEQDVLHRARLVLG